MPFSHEFCLVEILRADKLVVASASSIMIFVYMVAHRHHNLDSPKPVVCELNAYTRQSFWIFKNNEMNAKH